MNDIIAIWGKNGSGKSTVASYLACCLAGRGRKVAIIGANRHYGAIQRFFGASVDQEKSLRHILADEDNPLITQCFVECPRVKDVYIASLADDDECAGCRRQRPETVKRFLGIAKKRFDHTIVDCEDSTEDALSMLSLTEASHVVFVSTLNVQGAAFARACESLVAGLRITDKMEIVINACDASASAEASSYKLFGITRSYVKIPFCKDVERASEIGKPLTFFGEFIGKTARFRNAIAYLATELTDAAGVGRRGKSLGKTLKRESDKSTSACRYAKKIEFAGVDNERIA